MLSAVLFCLVKVHSESFSGEGYSGHMNSFLLESFMRYSGEMYSNDSQGKCPSFLEMISHRTAG